MSQYFDKDFFKFLLGFVAIVLLSCVFILATRLYESEFQRKMQPESVINVANPKP